MNTRWTDADVKAHEEQAPRIHIGIDSGTKTGLAIWDAENKQFREIRTVKIHEALQIVLVYADVATIKVYVEDARQVRFKTDAAKMKGAGSVCRDASIWEDFLTDHNIPFEMKRPSKAMTKWCSAMFEQVTGYQGKTSSHGRDAAMLVWGR